MEATRKRIILRIVAAAVGLAIGCPILVHFGHLYLPRVWGNLHLVNFIVAWLPAVFSILVAFIPDKDLGTRMRLTWRGILIFCGVLYSVFLWHQQDLTDRATAQQTQDAVNQAVQQANAHSDTKFDQVQRQVNGLDQSLDKTTATIGKQLDQTESDLDKSIGKVGKPDPPERPNFTFSLWKDDLTADKYPLLSESLTPEPDGNFKVRFAIRNDSSVVAQGIEEWIQICDRCVFAKEPSGFDKPEGSNDRTRHRIIPTVNAGVTVIEGNEFEVKPPLPGNRFSMIFRVTCSTCGPVQVTKEYWVIPDYSLSVAPAISN